MSEQWAVEKAREWWNKHAKEEPDMSCCYSEAQERATIEWAEEVNRDGVAALAAFLAEVAENARVIAQVGANREILEARAEVERLRAVLRSTARVLISFDGQPCYCDDYEAREYAGYGHSVKCEQARAALRGGA